MDRVNNRNSKNENLSPEDRQSLLAEYSRIGQQVAISTTMAWQATAFLVGGAFAAAGLIVAAGNYGLGSFIETFILGSVIVIALCIFKRWLIAREIWRCDVLYERQNEIEEKLGMHVSRDVMLLDEIKEKKGALPLGLTPDEQDRLLQLHAKHPSPGPVTRRFLVYIIWASIALWILLIIAQLCLWIVPWVLLNCGS